MKKYYNFENLECWRQARDLAVEIHRLSCSELINSDIVISEGLRKSANLVMSLIAQGKALGNDGEFVKHLQSAKASAAALSSNLIISREIGYLAEGTFLDYQDKTTHVTSLIGGLINAIKKNKE